MVFEKEILLSYQKPERNHALVEEGLRGWRSSAKYSTFKWEGKRPGSANKLPGCSEKKTKLEGRLEFQRPDHKNPEKLDQYHGQCPSHKT